MQVGGSGEGRRYCGASFGRKQPDGIFWPRESDMVSDGEPDLFVAGGDYERTRLAGLDVIAYGLPQINDVQDAPSEACVPGGWGG